MTAGHEGFIVGIGESALGRVPGRSMFSLQAEAAVAALADAGIDKSRVDGLIVQPSFMEPKVRHANSFAQHLGLSADTLRYHTTSTAGSVTSGGGALHEASMLIASGQCETVLIVSGDNMLSSQGRDAAVSLLANNRDPEFENPYGTFLPAAFGMIATRYMHDYDVVEEDFATVAVACRTRANNQPNAQMRDKKLTMDDALASPLVASPLRRVNCAIVSDGGCAVVVTRSPNAGRASTNAVAISAGAALYGMPGGHAIDDIGQLDDLYSIRTGMREISRTVLRQAGVSLSDVDVFESYDPFSHVPLLTFEGVGFCADGEGGALVRDGFLDNGPGKFWNTHGGLTGYCHPGNAGGLFMTLEAVRQLRGDAQYSQHPDPHVALILGLGANEGNFVGTVLTAVKDL